MILVLNLFLMTLNSILFSIFICFFALIKLLVPIKIVRINITKLCDFFLWCWASINYWLICVTSDTKFDVQGEINLKKEGWYLLIANHQSWADIVVIYSLFRNHIPMAKFFLKQQLLYIPFLGMTCWALNMPFMKRYSQKYLHKNPHKKGADLAATRKSCEKFKHSPTTIVNFVEGTRFRTDKRDEKPMFNHLLPPKTGGIAYVLNVMGDQFENIIDLTIAYPENRSNAFIDLLAGKVKRLVVHVDMLPVNEALRGDYFNDKEFKKSFQTWLTQRWENKDRILMSIYGQRAALSCELQVKN